MRLFSSLLFLTFVATPSALASLCWKPGANPFSEEPKAKRIDSGRVKLNWQDGFSNSRDCQKVDFLIKSHPRFQPAKYKLSDFTLKGQRTAVIRVETDGDYVFQIIAREDKGPPHGIDYKYSKMVTSYAKDWRRTSGFESSPPVTTTTQRPTTTTRRYKTPQTKSLSSASDNSGYGELYNEYEDEDGSKIEISNNQVIVRTRAPIPTAEELKKKQKQRSASGINSCIPILKKNVGHGSKMKQDRLIINFIRFMNKQPTKLVNEFLETKRSCAESQQKGYLRACPGGAQKCCSTPWQSCDGQDSSGCFSDFKTCDGRCFPTAWSDDGWPDCLDGSDEPDFTNLEDGKVLPYKFQCVECAGVVLSAGFLCTSSGQGLTASCVEGMMGRGDCNVCIPEFLELTAEE